MFIIISVLVLGDRELSSLLRHRLKELIDRKVSTFTTTSRRSELNEISWSNKKYV